MDITLSDAAKKHFVGEINRMGYKDIRIAIKAAGCGGNEYILSFCDDITADDATIAYEGFNLVVSKREMVYIFGLHIDYVKEGLQEGIKFSNPNASAKCGCGKSFTFPGVGK